MGQLLYADAIHIREQAKIDAARITTKSGNERRGAESALANFSQSLSNMRMMRAAGEAFNDAQGNIARRAEASSVGPLKMRLAAAEELGAVSAMAGAAGVGGSSVEMYNETVRLTGAMNEQRFAEDVATDDFGSRGAAGNIISSAVVGMDNNIYRANLDYTQYVDHKKPSTFERIVGFGLTAAATYFGGPQAGAAVMGVFEARQSARNGDFAGASDAVTGALRNGFGALQANRLTQPGKKQEYDDGDNNSSSTGSYGPGMSAPSARVDTRMFAHEPWRPSSALGSIILK